MVGAAAYLSPSTTRYSYRLLDVTEMPPPSEVGRVLDLAAGEQVVCRHRLMLHDGEPVELSWSYYQMSIATGTELTHRRRIPGGAPRVLAEVGYPQAALADRVSARMPTPDEWLC